MYDIERIIKIIKDIENYEKELNNLEISSIKDLEDSKNLHSSSMLCFAILNRAIDLGQEILVKEEYGMPNRYADIFNSLVKVGVMNENEAEEINQLIEFRNIIAHAYFQLTKKDIFRMIKGMSLINNFIGKVKKKVKTK